MASTATTYIGNINTAYPVAGVDNDTQGFRDNYANIKNGLTSLSNEVGVLQANSASKAETNNFNQNIIQNAQLQSVSKVVANHTIQTIGGSQVIDYTEGNYQIWKITSATNFNFVNFPVGANASVKLELYTLNTQTVSVTLVTSSTTNILLDTAANAPVSNPIAVTTSSPTVYEVTRSPIDYKGEGFNEMYLVRFVGGPFKAS